MPITFLCKNVIMFKDEIVCVAFLWNMDMNILWQIKLNNYRNKFSTVK